LFHSVSQKGGLSTSVEILQTKNYLQYKLYNVNHLDERKQNKRQAAIYFEALNSQYLPNIKREDTAQIIPPCSIISQH